MRFPPSPPKLPLRAAVALPFALLLVLGACTTQGARHRSSFAAAAHSNRLTHATVYGTAPQPAPLRGDACDALLAEALEQSCAGQGLTPDGRLADLALAVARASNGAQRPPSYSQVSFHAHRTGMPEPTPQVWLASGPSTRALAPALHRAVAEATASSHLSHCGAAAVSGSDGVTVALVLSNRVVALREGVPRHVELGAVLRLEGDLGPEHSQPALALTLPDGSVTRRPLGTGSHFAHSIVADQVGEYTIELLAHGPEGLTVVAMIPVSVGVPLLTEEPHFEEDPVESNGEEVAERLIALIADERERHGLRPLKLDARLKRIAHAHSEDMVSHHFIAHTSRRTGDASQRVSAAGLDAMLVLENIGRGYSAAELHRGLMESPGHRANILHPDAREIGIGVMVEREGDRLAFIATELFTELARKRLKQRR